jgi:hypothetical protein
MTDMRRRDATGVGTRAELGSLPATAINTLHAEGDEFRG